jgi:hypothetical protein
MTETKESWRVIAKIANEAEAQETLEYLKSEGLKVQMLPKDDYYVLVVPANELDVLEKEREAIILIKEALRGIKWTRVGASGLRDRGYIARTSEDVDISIDSKINYYRFAKGLKKYFPDIPVLPRDKNFRKTQRRKIIFVDYEGLGIDIQFGEYGLKENEEINELVGISTGVLTPYLSPADIAYRKLLRWAKFDADDIREMIKNGVIDIAELKRKIEESNELESKKNQMKAHLEEK